MQPPSLLPRLFIALGALNGLLYVGLGAFGAHALRGSIGLELLTLYQTASQYHGIHSLGLVATGLLAQHQSSRWLAAAGWLLITGIGLFCGSLYTLAITGTHAFGIITPVGGIAFMLGWLCLGIAALRLR